MRIISVLLGLLICVLVMLLWPQEEVESSFVKSCHFVSERIFLEPILMNPWLQRCLQVADHTQSQALPLQRQQLRMLLSQLDVSHLDLFEPQEVESIWTENKKSTGIQAEFIDGQLIVTEILPGSVAEVQQVKTGDQLISINNEAPSVSLAQELAGEYVFDRSGEKITLSLKPTDLSVDEGWKVIPQSAKSARLKVPSFRGEYFEGKKVGEMAKALEPYQKIILDLRKNEGGNFVSGLRLLSLFFCGPQDLGYLIRPKFPEKPKVNLPDDMDDTKQLDILNQSYYVNLQTFSEYPCLTQSLVVLVDHETASTAEMVAQALKDYRGAKVLGNPTGGKLLVGVWYPTPELGKGVKISIPEAVYQTKRGRQLEKNGVHLDGILDYRRGDFEKGQDSWLLEALRRF